MQQIINFFIKNSSRLLFLLLLTLSLVLIVQTHSFHRSSFVSSANGVTGFVYDKINSTKEFLHLKEENKTLADENARLRQLLYNSTGLNDSLEVLKRYPTPTEDFDVMPAKVIRNSFNLKENYLTIKGGTKQGIESDLGVINSNGVIGIIEQTSNNYATVQSILNTKSRINAKIKGANHFGTLQWDGKNTGYVQLTDIPRLADIFKGDTIVTGGISTIFPENIPIGVIEQAFTNETSNYYTINVRLFNDMTNIGYVYVIKNKNSEEIEELEETISNE